MQGHRLPCPVGTHNQFCARMPQLQAANRRRIKQSVAQASRAENQNQLCLPWQRLRPRRKKPRQKFEVKKSRGLTEPFPHGRGRDFLADLNSQPIFQQLSGIKVLRMAGVRHCRNRGDVIWGWTAQLVPGRREIDSELSLPAAASTSVTDAALWSGMRSLKLGLHRFFHWIRHRPQRLLSQRVRWRGELPLQDLL